tara:strand:- start:36 stop:947 length:912 start_codon:yes stop_codon:yes gene_type:complete
MADEGVVATDDPVGEIHRSDADLLAQQLQGAITGAAQDGTQANPVSTETESTGTTAESDLVVGETSPGSDLQSILSTLTDPRQQDAVRRIFADNSRLRNGQRDIEATLETRVQNAVTQAMTEVEDEAPDAELEAVTPEQRVLFDKIAREAGYIKQDDLDNISAQTYQSKANERGIDQWGNNFGAKNVDGSFVPSQDQMPFYADTASRLKDPRRGVTYEDLHILANYQGMVTQAYDQGKTDALNGNTQQAQRLTSAQTLQGSAPVIPQVNLRAARGSTGDRSDKVMARAWAVAKRNLPGNKMRS